MKTKAMRPQNDRVCWTVISPVTSGRFQVRGFSLSKGRSMMRLKAMAKERTPIMATVRAMSSPVGGMPSAASTAPA